MRRVVVLGLLLGLMALLQILQVGSDTAFNPFSLATFGFVLLAAYTLGQVAANLQLPKITGYIVTGLVFGPQILNVFSSAVEADLRVVNDLAIGLIALSAGAEMHLAGLRKIARSLLLIVLIKGGLILVAITGLVIGLANFIPFLAGQPIGLVASVGMILGVMAIGTSPAATIAVINETGAKGRLADTTLGVAVAKDIVMVILLALGIALARNFSAEGHGFEVAILGELALELFLSLLAGAALGGVIIAYLKYVRAEPWLFTVGVIFAMTAIAHQFHLEALLVFIVAGFVVQNASSLGHDFVELAERVALPVYVVFFSVAGAGLDLGALRTVLLIALAIAVVRAAAIYAGTAVATRLAGEPEEVRKNAWLSFVAQAGVVIGLSIIVENNLGALGTEIRTLVMGTVAIHLLIGPVLFKIALTRAGEVAGAEPDEEPEIVDEEEPAFFVLPPTLEEPVVALETRVYEALQSLAETASRGPLETARAVRGWPGEGRAEKEQRIESGWARELQIAVDRFWSEVHRTSLEAPRQISLELESRWFTDARWDTASQRWTKRLRRARRILRRL
ncbi:MAG: cation:proton antiporter, partial [Gemmatimonadetes bacterium]|nr:cation:proton antiporter [Gemmatimonadota bacterium]